MSKKKIESARFKIYEKDPAKTSQMEKKRWNMELNEAQNGQKEPKSIRISCKSQKDSK